MKEFIIDMNKFNPKLDFQDWEQIDETITYLISEKHPFITYKDEGCFHENIYLKYKDTIDCCIEKLYEEIIDYSLNQIMEGQYSFDDEFTAEKLYYLNMEMRTNMEERLDNGLKIREKETGRIYTIYNAIKTNNQWGLGIYLYIFEETTRTKPAFGLYRKEFDLI